MISKSDCVKIHLENVSVCYRLPLNQVFSFKEYLFRLIKREIRYEDIWALRNVNLKVYQGETLGIIGANGAGKSTLLQVIAQILRPVKGHVHIKGEVFPLLGVSSGFIQELTGRENIILRGVMLGFSKREMEARCERIIRFAKLKKSIDRPLWTYSSGMVARLGFSVSTDVQPEILIIDETLAVGDEWFREKCQIRISEFQKTGTTILLTSHSAALIRSMCQRALWLDKGEVKFIGPAEKAVNNYLKRNRVESNTESSIINKDDVSEPLTHEISA